MTINPFALDKDNTRSKSYYENHVSIEFQTRNNCSDKYLTLLLDISVILIVALRENSF